MTIASSQLRPTATERALLARAGDLAVRGRGCVSPNPPVGAVVAREGTVVGEGWHRGPGTLHAEAVALAEAGSAARGATLVCTLEPCSHQGRTPPCASAVVAAGVARVVIGCRDPLERGRPGGIAVLEASGVEVVLADRDARERCRELVAPFLVWSVERRPLVTLKMATSLDGKVATSSGETRWISGPAARAMVHRLRADQDAVAVGIGTALADDPLLTARDVEGPVRQPRRVVFDTAGRLPLDSALARSAAEAPVILVAGPEAPAARLEGLRRAGIEVLVVEGASPGERVRRAMAALGEGEIQSLLLEGGPRLAETALAAGAVDRVAWVVAPILVGGERAPGALSGEGLGPLAQVPRLRGVEVTRIGEDVLVSGRLRDLPEA